MTDKHNDINDDNIRTDDDDTTSADNNGNEAVSNGAPEGNEKVIYNNIEFAHPSEAQCARILDFYNIEWQYEPTTFPIDWDKDGNVIRSFSPDFYLPELDLYIELTTMSQKLVTKKNRKVRKLREIYPHINIKIFYQKDFKYLLLKYGLPH